MNVRRRRDLVCGGWLLVLAVIVPACGRAQPRARALPSATIPSPVTSAKAITPGSYVEGITSSGQARRYRLHVPPQYRAGAPMPLVVNLHGYNSNGEQQERVSQMSVKSDAAGFIAVHPEGLGEPQSWRFMNRAEGASDVEFIRDLIKHLESRLSIDAKRIYVTGISNGAQMSYRLACDLGDTLAAFAPVAGGYPPFKDCDPPRPVPVVAFHGTADNLLPYEGQPPVFLPVRTWAANWAARNGCSATAKVTFEKGDVIGETWSGCRDNADVTLYTINGKGHSWPGSAMPERITTQDVDATDVMWEFFAAHPRR